MLGLIPTYQPAKPPTYDTIRYDTKYKKDIFFGKITSVHSFIHTYRPKKFTTRRVRLERRERVEREKFSFGFWW